MQDSRAPSAGRWAELKADFAPRTLVQTISVGLVLALVNALLSTALVSLIFRGDLEQALPIGIANALTASAAIGLVLAFFSSFPGAYAGVQDASAAIIGLSAAAITGVVAGLAAVDTVVAMMAVTSLATGLTLLAIGYLGLGEMARFVPFPVIGGLLAGTGYLILTGSLAILGLDSTASVTDPRSVGALWPGIVLAGLLYWGTRNAWRSRTYLLFLLVAIVGFHLTIWLAGVSRREAIGHGWLLGPFNGALSPRSVIDAFSGTNWDLIAGQALGLATILLIVPITLLLYASALEVETETGIEIKRELTATGWANLASGAMGGPPGYMYLADTVIASRLVGKHRGPAVVSAVTVLAVVTFGGSLLELLPVFVVGGLLLFVGAEFLHEWLWASRRRMGRLDYTLMVAIAITIATVGFLPGVATGLVAAIVLFVMRYSRIDVVKHSLTGAEQRSNIERSRAATEYLDQVGRVIVILELQGFVFFGTASRILTRIREFPVTRPWVRFIVCDFRRVSGVDSSAVAVFQLIITHGREHGAVLVLTGMSPMVRAQFEDVISHGEKLVRVQPDLDHGLAWCEDEILSISDVVDDSGRSLPQGLEDALAGYLDIRSMSAGEELMHQGDPSPGIFMIKSGRATVVQERDHGDPMRLRLLLSGTVLGEISLYLDEPCTATVVADTACEVLHLSPHGFHQLCAHDPAVAARLHEFVARTLAGRVRHANRTIRALLD